MDGDEEVEDATCVDDTCADVAVVDNVDEKHELGDNEEGGMQLDDALLVDGPVGVADGHVLALEGVLAVEATGFLLASEDSEHVGVGFVDVSAAMATVLYYS